jgi:hypothetical protein
MSTARQARRVAATAGASIPGAGMGTGSLAPACRIGCAAAGPSIRRPRPARFAPDADVDSAQSFTRRLASCRCREQGICCGPVAYDELRLDDLSSLSCDDHFHVAENRIAHTRLE